MIENGRTLVVHDDKRARRIATALEALRLVLDPVEFATVRDTIFIAARRSGVWSIVAVANEGSGVHVNPTRCGEAR